MKKQELSVSIKPDPDQNTSGVSKFIKQQRIFFGLPMYGGMCTQNMFQGMMTFSGLAGKHGLKWYAGQIVNESLIPRARNAIVAQFLSTDATHLMFIDSDIGFKTDDILKLLIHDRPIVGGICPMKSIPATYAFNRKKGGEVFGDLHEVTSVGTGFMMIKRYVVEEMVRHYPELKINSGVKMYDVYGKNMYAFFDTIIDENKNYLPEDYAFCYRWSKLGGKIYADVSIDLSHAGHHVFQGNPSEVKNMLR